MTDSALDPRSRAVDQLLRFDPAVVASVEAAVDESPDDDDAVAFAAYLSLLGTDERDAASARAMIDEREVRASVDEVSHLGAARAWARGDWRRASELLDHLLLADPTDLLALGIGHQLDFLLGDAINLRDRVGRSIGVLDSDSPGYGYALGMQAFGLEECGHYAQAEAAGLEALSRCSTDVWAIHAVVHVYEMQGRVDDGLSFLTDRRKQWIDGNMFAIHNAWHLALYLLEQGRAADALEVYDGLINPSGSTGVAIELVDAAAMLWRFHVDGADVGDRWGRVGDAWNAALELSSSWYTFNDWHGVMACVGAGRLADARRIVERLERYVASARPPDTNHLMASLVGLPACRATLAYGEGRWDDAAAELWSIRGYNHRFGGSHAQRDALNRTMVDALLRAGESHIANALCRERLALRPSSSWYAARMA